MPKFSVGQKVKTTDNKAGSVTKVPTATTKPPTDTYHVRFDDGSEGDFTEAQLTAA